MSAERIFKTPQQTRAEKDALVKLETLALIRKNAQFLADHRVIRQEQVPLCVAMYISKNLEIVDKIYGPDLEAYMAYRNHKAGIPA